MTGEGLIGGGESTHGYLLVFLGGVMVGSVIRASIGVLPSSAVSRIRARILPGE